MIKFKQYNVKAIIEHYLFHEQYTAIKAFEWDYTHKYLKGKLDMEEALTKYDQRALSDLVKRACPTNHPKIAEIGSWKGMSASVLASAFPQCTVYAIDTWQGSLDTWGWDLAHKYDVLSVFRQNMRLLDINDRVFPWVMTSHEASQRVRDNTIDFLFIDGDHRYKEFKQDLIDWLPKVKIGGVIAGHDCDVDYWRVGEEKLPSLYTTEELKVLAQHQDSINANLDKDYVSGLGHPGIAKALYEVFGRDYTVNYMPNNWWHVARTSIWHHCIPIPRTQLE